MATICLDYDGTYTIFPKVFDVLIEECLKTNTKIILCTMRHPYEKDDTLELIAERIPVYYTGRKAKRTFLLNVGVIVDVWIDDVPSFILQDAGPIKRGM